MTKNKVPAFDVSSLDRSVRPGDDFEQFANGGWKKANPVPNDESSWGSFSVLNKDNQEVKLKGIITRLLNQGNHELGSDEQKIVDMYRSFMNTERIEELGLTPIEDLLEQIDKITSIQSWINLHAKLLKKGVKFPIRAYVGTDDKDPSKNSVFWRQGGLSLGDRGYYDSTDKKSVKLLEQLAEHVDKMFESAELEKNVSGKDIVEFETKLAKLHKTKVEMRDPVAIYNSIKLEKLSKGKSKVDWTEFADKSEFNDDSIVLHDPNYLKKVGELLNGTNLDILRGYSTWQVLRAFATILPKEIELEDFRFFRTVLYGIDKQKPRDIRSVIATQAIGDGMIMGKLYAKEYFPESSKQKVSEMIENIRSIYSERIEKLDWMSKETREKAHKKLSAFRYKIGYPDKWVDTSDIQISPDSLIKNTLSVRQWLHNFEISKIGKKVDRSEWAMPPQIINAYYEPNANEIVFPAGILQPPFFNAEADDAINYGGIMAVIGHEFSHGFDDEGSQYDEVGSLKNWWTEIDRQKFDELAKKLSKYFSGLQPLEGVNINGDLTLGENIGDLGGITLSYCALERSIGRNGDPGLIDGFTWQQRFFLGWAKIWCENITEEHLRRQIKTDPHSPDRFRIMGPLPHFDPFYEAFDIKKGDKMYIEPSKRIVIW